MDEVCTSIFVTTSTSAMVIFPYYVRTIITRNSEKFDFNTRKMLTHWIYSGKCSQEFWFLQLKTLSKQDTFKVSNKDSRAMCEISSK